MTNDGGPAHGPEVARLIKACRQVVENYETAAKERYDECCWDVFEGVGPIKDALANIDAMLEARKEKR